MAMQKAFLDEWDSGELTPTVRKLHAVSQNGYPDDHITNVIITREKEPVPVSVADEEWDVLARGSPSCL